MSDNTGIGWCDHTFNPVWGCTKVSEGCRFCYAETLDNKFHRGVHWDSKKVRKKSSTSYWEKPKKWNKDAEKKFRRPARVFSGSMCDVFEDHPTTRKEMSRLWPLIKRTPNLHWLLLTKRPENFEAFLPGDWGDGYPNVWLGVSIESDRYAWRKRFLAETPAAVRFISYEPALGPLLETGLDGIDWLIYGGESGRSRRPDSREWAIDIHGRCASEKVAFFFKQSSAMRPGWVDPSIPMGVYGTKQFPTPFGVEAKLSYPGGLFD